MPRAATRCPEDRRSCSGEVGEGRQHPGAPSPAQGDLTRPHRQKHGKDSENQTARTQSTKGGQKPHAEAKKGGCLAKIVKTVLTAQSTHPGYRRKSCTPPELGKHSENEKRQCTGAQAKIKQMLGGPDKGSKAVITNTPQQAITNSL